MSAVANRLGDNTNQTWTSGCSLPLTELLNEFRKSQRGKKTQTMLTKIKKQELFKAKIKPFSQLLQWGKRTEPTRSSDTILAALFVLN